MKKRVKVYLKKDFLDALSSATLKEGLVGREFNTYAGITKTLILDYLNDPKPKTKFENLKQFMPREYKGITIPVTLEFYPYVLDKLTELQLQVPFKWPIATICHMLTLYSLGYRLEDQIMNLSGALGMSYTEAVFAESRKAKRSTKKILDEIHLEEEAFNIDERYLI